MSRGQLAVDSVDAVHFTHGGFTDPEPYSFDNPCPPTSTRIELYNAYKESKRNQPPGAREPPEAEVEIVNLIAYKDPSIRGPRCRTPPWSAGGRRSASATVTV